MGLRSVKTHTKAMKRIEQTRKAYSCYADEENEICSHGSQGSGGDQYQSRVSVMADVSGTYSTTTLFLTAKNASLETR